MSYHFRQTARSHNVPRMDQSIEMAGRFLNLFPQIIIGVEVKHIRHEVQSILVVGDFGVQTGEVEPVRQVILVDFTEVLVPPRRDKLNEIPARG